MWCLPGVQYRYSIRNDHVRTSSQHCWLASRRQTRDREDGLLRAVASDGYEEKEEEVALVFYAYIVLTK